MSAVAGTTPENLPVEKQSVRDAARGWWIGVRAGELGALPIVIGIVLIAIYFLSRNSHFLTAGNFVNLLLQTAPYAVIAMGVTFALLLGEIDLSIGFVSGVDQGPDQRARNHEVPALDKRRARGDDGNRAHGTSSGFTSTPR